MQMNPVYKYIYMYIYLLENLHTVHACCFCTSMRTAKIFGFIKNKIFVIHTFNYFIIILFCNCVQGASHA